MSQMQTTVEPRGGKGHGGSGGGPGDGRDRPSGPPKSGPFTPYKPEQGRWTRTGTLVGVGVMIAWGAKAIYDELQVFQGDDIVSLLITVGIPILFAVVCGYIAWHYTYAKRSSSDFMIATEGEMKKVNWSSRREVIGSTKVVILFTVFLAVFLFLADLGFQQLFKWIGALRT